MKNLSKLKAIKELEENLREQQAKHSSRMQEAALRGCGARDDAKPATDSFVNVETSSITISFNFPATLDPRTSETIHAESIVACARFGSSNKEPGKPVR